MAYICIVLHLHCNGDRAEINRRVLLPFRRASHLLPGASLPCCSSSRPSFAGVGLRCHAPVGAIPSYFILMYQLCSALCLTAFMGSKTDGLSCSGQGAAPPRNRR